MLSSVQSLSCVRLFATPWTAARQASLSITNSHSLLKLMSIESVMPSNHLILYHPLFLLPSIFPSIRVFLNESVLSHQMAKVFGFQHQQHTTIQDYRNGISHLPTPTPNDTHPRDTFEKPLEQCIPNYNVPTNLK